MNKFSRLTRGKTSQSVWVQRAGRAKRSFDIEAQAFLLYEKSVFQRQRKCKKKNFGDGDGEEMEPDGVIEDERLGDEDDWLDEEDEEQIIDADDEHWNDDESKWTWQWCKKIDPDLRRWLSSENCH